MKIPEQYQEYINKFIDILSQDENVDLSIFNNNLQSLQIMVEDNNENYPAGYNRHNNTIRLKNDESISSIYHELLHVASTKIEDELIYSGVSQEVIETKLVLGLGLTEGITEYLREQYFGILNKSNYFLEKFYVRQLLGLVSEKSIKNSYFTADNEEFLNELLKYASFDKIKRFLYNLDTYTISMQHPESADIENIQNAITSCTDFLITAYYNKLNIINGEAASEKMEEYIDGFNMYIVEPSLNNQEFILLPSKDALIKINVLKQVDNNSKSI